METATTTHFSYGAIVKNSSYLAVFLSSAEWLGLTPTSIIVLTSFILVDMVTGILKSISLQGTSAVKSSVLERGLLSKGLLITVPVVLASSGKAIGMDSILMAQSFLNVLILSEAYSIIGNIYSISTGKEKNEFDAVAFVLGEIKRLLKKFIKDD